MRISGRPRSIRPEPKTASGLTAIEIGFCRDVEYTRDPSSPGEYRVA